jgi:hypothetical protein
VNDADLLARAFAAYLQRLDPDLSDEQACELAVWLRRVDEREFLDALDAVVTEVERLMRQEGSYVLH